MPIQPVKMCDANALESGQMMRFEPEGMDPVVLCNVNGTFRLVDDECTHAIASLSEGRLDGNILYCPLHGGSFDVNTGKATSLPCKFALATHAVEIRDGIVWMVQA